MAIRKIREIGDEVLTKVCKEVTKMTPRTTELIDDMLETMYEAMGVGLAVKCPTGCANHPAYQATYPTPYGLPSTNRPPPSNPGIGLAHGYHYSVRIQANYCTQGTRSSHLYCYSHTT